MDPSYDEPPSLINQRCCCCTQGALARTPFIKSLKEPPKGEEAEQQQQHAPAAGYPTLHGIDMRLAAMLAHLDDYVDSNLGNPKTLQGRALRVATHTIHAIAGYTPVVGMRIKQLMVEIVSRSVGRWVVSYGLE